MGICASQSESYSRHEVMAKQVRPWLANPDELEAQSAISCFRCQPAYSIGDSDELPSKSPNVQMQSLPSRHHKLKSL